MSLRYLTIGIVCFALVGPAVALAEIPAPHAEQITSLIIEARLEPSGALDVREIIDYDLAGASPHRLSHNLPLTYQDDQGRSYRVSFHLTSASQDGRSFTPGLQVDPFTARLDLPAPAATSRYQLHYTLAPVVLQGETADVFKLTATGQGWSVPVAAATLKLHTPGHQPDNLTCFTGSGATTSGNCSVTQDGEVATIATHSPLAPGQGLTLYSDFPTGSFQSYLEVYRLPTNWAPWVIAGVVVMLLLGLAGWLAISRSSRHKRYILKAHEDSRPPPV